MQCEKIGVKNFHGSVDITDPGYKEDVWCPMDNVKIKKGVYACIVWYHTDEKKYHGKSHACKTVGIIGIYRNGKIPKRKKMKNTGRIQVVAGVAGFFHNKPDYDDEMWGKFCEDIKIGDAWITKDGFFSSAGYGNGWYEVYALTKKNKIVALEIRFL